ncbi:MAG: SAM-dependent methyltransferase [Ruminococcus flavefaciens]|nr:SAM-dependent methyltransferase [Ruminococcus flavefaciens]MCM1362848.1 SAM-dependent methyltransferase [Clostridiales bacterium]
MDSDIDEALRVEQSKNGGNGGNYPDIKLFIELDSAKIPVMIECKGKKGDFCKLNENGEPDNKKKDGTSNLKNISKYAVNGAVHYATAVFKFADNYSRIIAVGINGYKDSDDTVYEISAWLISKKNFGVPKKIGDFSDLSFLSAGNRPALSAMLKDILLTDAEKERMAYEFENTIEANLKTLNQTMHDDLHIAVGDRVELIAAMIMAGLGVKDEDDNYEVYGLTTSDLKGNNPSSRNHDGWIIYNHVADFLEKKNLPRDKRESIKNTLERVLLHSNLEEPRRVKDTSRTESRLKTVYREVEFNIMPTFVSDVHLDFTGKLFNVLNEWVDIPDGERNDVVLTPRYVTELMAKLAEVNMDSYVWDYAAGSGGFLISAMKLMLKDAQLKYVDSPAKYAEKLSDIKKFQLLGCEIRPDIYLLAVLNMILMKDGSATILNVDSLEKFSGTYEQGERKGEIFPADVFLLNPPYSAAGKGFIFVEKALARMSKGKACVLIQENAGSGNGLPYTKRLLKHNTLLASIHMSDIFNGKASVQTAIYLFEVGKPHDKDKYVKFIDFSDDGYTRSNRKKSSLDVNLRDTGNAIARYQEVADVILGRKLLRDCEYLTDATYIEDKITLEGNDWTFNQHKKIDLIPTEDDFRKLVADYLSWKVGAILREEIEVENE